jgi:hypothetical protein
VQARPVDVLCGYALELVVGGLRGARGVLGRLIAADDTRSMRPTACVAPPPARHADEERLRRTLERPAPLPEAYRDDRLVLLVRDARTLFAHWDLTPWTERPTDAGEARLVLRLHDLTFLDFAEAGSWRHEDFDVERLVGSRYVPVARAPGTYRAEIGWRWRDGRFVARARSGTLTTARVDAPGGEPVRWRTVRLEIASGTAPRTVAHDAPAPPGAPRTPPPVPDVGRGRATASEERHRRGG